MYHQYFILSLNNVMLFTSFKKAHERARQLNQWQSTGGVMVLGYEMFRILTNPTTKKFRLSIMETYQKTLIDPGKPFDLM